MVKETSEVGLSGLQSSPAEWVEKDFPGLGIVPENAIERRGEWQGDLGDRLLSGWGPKNQGRTRSKLLPLL